VYDSYQALAKYFEESSDYKTAVYFYEKCWEISNLTANVEGAGASTPLHLAPFVLYLDLSLRNCCHSVATAYNLAHLH
jgi:hypothetical protein